MTKYENKEICTKCGGVCCKQMGCHFSPQDFKLVTFYTLKHEIDKGFISIDWWEGNAENEEDEETRTRTYFLRMRNVDAPVVDPSYGGRCKVLTDTGCPLSYDERPMGGRMLIPSTNGCGSTYGKRECAIDWLPFETTLVNLYNHYLDRNDI